MLLSSALWPDRNQFSFTVLLNTRTNSTAPKYIKEIKMFFLCGVVALYIFNLDQQLRFSASMVLVHAALDGYILSRLMTTL